MKEIKTKSIIKDIKALDKAADVSYRAKNAYIRTKKQAEQTQQTGHDNFVEYAGDKIKEGTKTVARETGQAVGRQGKKAVHKQAKQLVQRKATTPGQEREMAKQKYTLTNKLAKQRFAQSRAKARFSRNRVMQVAENKTAQAVQNSVYIPTEKTAWRPAAHKVSCTGRTVKQDIHCGGKTLKEAAKGTIKLSQRSVKTARHSAKAAVKISQAAKTAQAMQKEAQAARVAARAGAVSAKTTAKVMAATIKAIIAAAKGLIALIAAGGWIALIIILVLCLAGLLSGSVFGVFFSNESYGPSTPIMTEIINQVNEEFAAEIQRIQNENPHDSLELSGNGSSISVGNWREILGVYAVKVAADPENGREVATLDDAKVEILRDVFWDMNRINYWLETIEHEETVTTILHIIVTSKSHADMIDEYGFNALQVKLLNEMMQEEYQQLFLRLSGSQADIGLSP